MILILMMLMILLILPEAGILLPGAILLMQLDLEVEMKKWKWNLQAEILSSVLFRGLSMV